jgi:hypothetical protein
MTTLINERQGIERKEEMKKRTKEGQRGDRTGREGSKKEDGGRRAKADQGVIDKGSDARRHLSGRASAGPVSKGFGVN